MCGDEVWAFESEGGRDDNTCGELLQCPSDCWDLHNLEQDKICQGICWVAAIDAGGIICKIESERCGDDEGGWGCSKQDFNPIDDMVTS